MRAVELLKLQAEMAFEEVTTAIEAVTEKQSWAVLPNNGPDYIHTDGSIHGITLHIASCKRIYGSVAFRNTEVRWRDTAAQLDAIEPSWEKAVEYLHESQKYWMSTWADLVDEDLTREVPNFRLTMLPAWRILRMMVHHDSWHAGQIAMVRYGVGESDTPPPSAAEDIRQSCSDLPTW